jgi:long-chain acyl-CoA synthetase
MNDADAAASRPWLRWYPQGVPEHVAVPEIALTEFLHAAARDFPRRKAIRFLGRTMTYRALDESVERFAEGLQSIGVGIGDRVALVLPNCPQNVIAFFAVLRLGAVVVQHNPLYTPSELEHQLADSRASVAIVYDGAYSRLAQVRERTSLQHVVVTSLADYLPSGKRVALRLPFGGARDKREQLVTPLPADAPVVHFSDLLGGRHAPVAPIVVTPDDLALLQYTGGTTGLPKGAMLTHRNLVANACQAAAWDPQMQRGNETVLAALPMFHVYGLTMCLTLNMLIAGTLVLLPTFELGLLFKAIDKTRPTVFPGVPPMYDQIVRSRRTGRHDLRSIRACVSGAMRLPPETVEQFRRLTGGHLVEGYGLTESSPVALANPLNDNARPGTIGLPLPSTDVRFADVDDPTQVVPFGTPGELCIRGPQVFAGYWGQQEESATMLQDGWLHTGDVAVMDEDGFVTIVDRKRDVILASGFSIFPTEIEEVLAEHPAVAECAVAGVAHFYRGETVKAFVVLHAGAAVSEDELRGFCSAQLAAYKVPSSFEFRADLPRNMLGKVLRRVLRDEHEAARNRAATSAPVTGPVVAVIDAPITAVNGTAHAPKHAGPDDADDKRPKPYTEPADASGLLDELERLTKLHDSGALTDDQFEAVKARLLSS